MNTLIMMLLACSVDSGVDQPIDPRQDWELFVPIGGPDLQMRPTIRWYSDSSISGLASESARDWELHLSCGIDLVQVESPYDADVSITCDDFEHVGSSFLMTDDHGKVTLTAQACAAGGGLMMQYAFALALGFSQQPTWFDNATMGNKAWLELMQSGSEIQSWSMIETDGWRAWALQRGAPGCGPDELGWSWIVYPDFYRTSPTHDVAQQLVDLSPQLFSR